jgi:uncharacterized membrane protein YccC
VQSFRDTFFVRRGQGGEAYLASEPRERLVDQPIAKRRRIELKKLTSWEILYAVAMGIACALSYATITQVLARFVDEPTKLLGGMWAVVATIFVFRESRTTTLAAGTARLFATCVSFALCLVYLLIFPVSGPGIAVLIALGTIVMLLLGREEDAVTTGITTAVVLLAAAISSRQAWQQPILRLIDTIVGIVIGVACKWCASYAFYRAVGQPVR